MQHNNKRKRSDACNRTRRIFLAVGATAPPARPRHKSSTLPGPPPQVSSTGAAKPLPCQRDPAASRVACVLLKSRASNRAGATTLGAGG